MKRRRCKKFEGGSKYRKREPGTELGELHAEQPCSGSDQSWDIPDLVGKSYEFRDHRNYGRYGDYGGQNAPYVPNIDYSDGRGRIQMYLPHPAQREERERERERENGPPRRPQNDRKSCFAKPAMSRQAATGFRWGKRDLRSIGFWLTP